MLNGFGKQIVAKNITCLAFTITKAKYNITIEVAKYAI
jgi:hypothetical protein